MSQHRTVNLLGVPIDSMPVSELIDRMQSLLHSEQRAIISNVNVHAMNIAYEQPRFRQILAQESELVFCDGMGVRLGAKMTGQHIDYRYTPPDWIEDLSRMCVDNDFSMYFIGSKEGVAQRAADILREQFPALRIVGVQHGFFNKDPQHSENKAVIEAINAANPDILVVGFGMPLQEYWIHDNWSALNARMALPVGALFDYVAGEVYRAPRWITDNGLEWLARLLIEPRRLWRRYVIGNPRFLWRVIRHYHLKPTAPLPNTTSA